MLCRKIAGGGNAYFSICGAGETTLQNEIADITYSILKNGHYVNITTNGTIEKRLKEILELKKVKPAELSRKTGISRGNISHYLNGDFVPKQDYLYLIATTLDVNPFYLMGVSEDKKLPLTLRQQVLSKIERMSNAQLNKLNNFIDQFIFDSDIKGDGDNKI